ncbi:MAG: hypothetical protein AAF560_09815 [Acidobacteriota bacterium]
MTTRYLFEECQPEWGLPAASRRLMNLTNEEKGLIDFREKQGLPPDQVEQLRRSLEVTKTEVRLDQKAFNWIIDQRLRFLEEHRRRYDLYCCQPDRPEPSIGFTEGSTFVEAGWVPIESSQKENYYHFSSESGELMGLVGLHVSLKLVSNWLWVTWEHVDNPQRFAYQLMQDDLEDDARREIFVAYDMCDRDPAQPCLWMNYALNGLQTAFMDGQGRPVLLSNSVFETSNPESSCMSCHARSSIGSGDRRIDLFGLDAVGPPSPEWFDRAPLPDRPFLQLDFVNSLANARPCKEICKEQPEHCLNFVEDPDNGR